MSLLYGFLISVNVTQVQFDIDPNNSSGNGLLVSVGGNRVEDEIGECTCSL